MHKKSFLWCEESSTEHELPVRVSYCHFFYRGEKTFTPKTRKTQRDRFCDNMRKFIFVHVFQFTGSNIYTSFTQNIYVYWLNEYWWNAENRELLPILNANGPFPSSEERMLLQTSKNLSNTYVSDIATLWLDIMKLCCQFAMVAWSTVIPYCDSSVRRRDMTINTGMSMIRHLSDIKPSKCKRGQIKETQRFVRDKNGIRTSSARRWCHMFNYKRLWWHLAPVHAEFTEGLLE